MSICEDNICFSPPLPPTIWGELCFCFDTDFPIDEISSIIGVRPTEQNEDKNASGMHMRGHRIRDTGLLYLTRLTLLKVT